MRWTWILLMSLSLALAACGKDDKKGGDDKGKTDKGKDDKGKADKGKDTKSSGPSGACDLREKQNMCAEYYGMATKDWVKEQCDFQKVATLDKCPTDGEIGRCIQFEGTPQQIASVYYAGGESMLGMCDQMKGKTVKP